MNGIVAGIDCEAAARNQQVQARFQTLCALVARCRRTSAARDNRDFAAVDSEIALRLNAVARRGHRDRAAVDDDVAFGLVAVIGRDYSVAARVNRYNAVFHTYAVFTLDCVICRGYGQAAARDYQIVLALNAVFVIARYRKASFTVYAQIVLREDCRSRLVLAVGEIIGFAVRKPVHRAFRKRDYRLISVFDIYRRTVQAGYIDAA